MLQGKIGIGKVLFNIILHLIDHGPVAFGFADGHIGAEYIGQIFEQNPLHLINGFRLFQQLQPDRSILRRQLIL
ncbi:hypothetical protein D3C75_1369260 [compost metagenome]